MRVALIRDDPLRTAAGYATPLLSVGPAASIPHRILCFPRHPPATTISGTAPLSSSPDACSSRAAPLAGAAHPLRAPLSPPSHSSLPGTPRPSSAGLTPRRLRLRASPARCTRPPACPAPRHGRSFSRATRCLRARCDVFGAIPLQACIRHSAKTRRAASASSAASAAPVANRLRRLRRFTACCDVPRGILTLALPASACRALPIQCASLAACASHATIPPHPQRPVQRLSPCCDHSRRFRPQA
ncbi:hypothetical protein B0H14DRAFT_1470193 [Mycena olivaceomarginata]|nr:hypothetical protein B0H14DRAFT_1470193 [Mycena olivaceomarginata]